MKQSTLMIQAHTSYQHPVCFCKTEQSAFDASNTILNLKIHHTRIKTCRRQYPIENPTKTPPYYHLRLHSFQAGSNHNMFQLENSLYSTSLFFTSKFNPVPFRFPPSSVSHTVNLKYFFPTQTHASTARFHRIYCAVDT